MRQPVSPSRSFYQGLSLWSQLTCAIQHRSQFRTLHRRFTVSKILLQRSYATQAGRMAVGRLGWRIFGDLLVRYSKEVSAKDAVP